MFVVSKLFPPFPNPNLLYFCQADVEPCPSTHVSHDLISDYLLSCAVTTKYTHIAFVGLIRRPFGRPGGSRIGAPVPALTLSPSNPAAVGSSRSSMVVTLLHRPPDIGLFFSSFFF